MVPVCLGGLCANNVRAHIAKVLGHIAICATASRSSQTNAIVHDGDDKQNLGHPDNLVAVCPSSPTCLPGAKQQPSTNRATVKNCTDNKGLCCKKPSQIQHHACVLLYCVWGRCIASLVQAISALAWRFDNRSP